MAGTLMILGSVNARLEAILRLQIENSSGHLHIFDYPTQARVQAVETDSILGTGVLAGYELKLPFVAGATVTIDRIP
jgi:hypothetical protein